MTTLIKAKTLEEFAENLRQDAVALANSEEHEMMLADSFTQFVFDMLSEAGEFDDPLVCYHRARGMEISGYAIDQDEGRLDVLVTLHTNSIPLITVRRQQVEVAFSRLRSFVEWALSGRYTQLEESSPTFDMAAHIYAFRNSVTQVRACVITDGRTTVTSLPEEKIEGIPIIKSLWDIVRLYRLYSSGLREESITIDFQEQHDEPIPCLEASTDGSEYRAFLALLPGEVLRSIYADFWFSAVGAQRKIVPAS